jgi:hypothetical protein
MAMGSLDKNRQGCHDYPASLRYGKGVQFGLEYAKKDNNEKNAVNTASLEVSDGQ